MNRSNSILNIESMLNIVDDYFPKPKTKPKEKKKLKSNSKKNLKPKKGKKKKQPEIDPFDINDEDIKHYDKSEDSYSSDTSRTRKRKLLKKKFLKEYEEKRKYELEEANILNKYGRNKKSQRLIEELRRQRQKNNYKSNYNSNSGANLYKEDSSSLYPSLPDKENPGCSLSYVPAYEKAKMDTIQKKNGTINSNWDDIPINIRKSHILPGEEPLYSEDNKRKVYDETEERTYRADLAGEFWSKRC